VVDLQFTVPATNTDGTRPANVSRAEAYAVTVPVTATPLTDEQLLKLATKIGDVRVKAPRNPNNTADADDPSDEVDAPEGPGLDQGSLARFEETLTAEMLSPVEVPKDPKAAASTAGDEDAPRPRLQRSAVAARGRAARAAAAATVHSENRLRRDQCHSDVAGGRRPGGRGAA